jgi:hypothetical protein
MVLEVLDRQVPTLSPTEARWLKSEYDDQIAGGTYTARALAALDSAEYHKRVARDHLDDTLTILRKLVRSAPTGQRETKLWIALAAAMMDPQFWRSVEVLIQRKVVSPEINGVKELHFDNHVGWAETILKRAVLPMMGDGIR